MTTQTTDPVIVPVPADDTMAEEPAEWIGRITSLKNAAWLIAAATGTVITPELDGAVDTVIQAGIVAIFGLITIYNAIRQGLRTREAVYSPATAAAIAEAPRAEVLPGNPKDMEDLRQTARTTERRETTNTCWHCRRQRWIRWIRARR